MKKNNTFDRKKFFRDFVNLDYHHKNRTFIYHEFGCNDGNIAILYYKILKKMSIKTHLYLYDSFKGLPNSKDIRDCHPDFYFGNYSIKKEILKKNLKKNNIPEDNYTILNKFFKHLSKKDKNKIRHPKADLVYFDADYYTSTIDAFNFIKSFLTNRSILYFDNIYSFSGNPNKGELAAINHFNKVNKSCGIVKYPMLDQNSNRVYIFWDNTLNDLL